jgi:Zn-dependent protease with chaperone function
MSANLKISDVAERGGRVRDRLQDRSSAAVAGPLRGLRPEALVMVMLALVCELPALAIRGMILYATLVVVTLSTHPWGLAMEEVFLLPFAWPALALLAPFPSGWLWRQREGGREPSERERLAYEDSIKTLEADCGERLRLPAGWFVIDSVYPDAAVCGDTLMLSHALMESEHLTAVLAHELGHVNSSDGRLSAAVNRVLIRRGRGRASRTLVLRLACGGCGLKLAARAFGAYWRAREYAADAYAARLGQGEELADFLEVHALILDQPIPSRWSAKHTHPPSELRIERLRAYAEREQRAGGPEAGGLEAGGLEAGGLEAGESEAGGLEAGGR